MYISGKGGEELLESGCGGTVDGQRKSPTEEERQESRRPGRVKTRPARMAEGQPTTVSFKSPSP